LPPLSQLSLVRQIVLARRVPSPFDFCNEWGTSGVEPRRLSTMNRFSASKRRIKHRISQRFSVEYGPFRRLLESHSRTSSVRIADLILPVVAVILTGWIVGYTGYLSRTLSAALIHFAYNIAMPALLIVTIAQEPAHSLLRWRFLVAFGGGSLLCFILVFGIMSIQFSRSLASRTMHGMAASMTNTGFVALPVLQAIYGQRAVLPAAIATVFRGRCDVSSGRDLPRTW
jgi:Membrane transport protein